MAEMDILYDGMKAQVEAMIWIKAQEMMREKYRETMKKHIAKDYDAYREYANRKQREYYQANRAKFLERNRRYRQRKKEEAAIAVHSSVF
jgi:hypothetical protein